ncbi:hypothetical protein GQX74_007655 [Glossina fuscipes]|nr:hypothetical protein GQX74_007655 [Glossina fuscipes]
MYILTKCISSFKFIESSSLKFYKIIKIRKISTSDTSFFLLLINILRPQTALFVVDVIVYNS